jgi:NAD(P)-dependent dehydrogenase (short-subunit alcohol dehydrogenase family)
MIKAGKGKLINVAANAALRGVARMGAYCASKDVVIRITESMSAELLDSNINVNSAMLSIIDTPENRTPCRMPMYIAGCCQKRWLK